MTRSRQLLHTITVIILISFCHLCHAENDCLAREGDRPSIGLVLGGGGARGIAHIGVIRKLEEMNIPVDCITGTSMGALVGALYAAGISADELEAMVNSLDWDSLFSDDTPRQDLPYRRKRDDVFGLYGPKIGASRHSSLVTSGLVSGQKLSVTFESIVNQRIKSSNFEDLLIPFKAITADLVSGDKVILESGSIAFAMRASISIPGIFNPVVDGKRLLVDGGIVDNLPIQVAREMGADRIIAINVSSALRTKDQLNNALTILDQLSNIMIAKGMTSQINSLNDNDMLITPKLGERVTAMDFKESEQAITIGYHAAEEMEEKLAILSISSDQYQHYAITQPTIEPPIIAFIELDNSSRLSDELVLKKLDLTLGKPLNHRKLEKSIERVYGTGFLEWVRYQVIEKRGENGLKLIVKQDPRGSEFIEWGGDLHSDRFDNSFNLRLAYLKSNIDKLGSDLRIAAQIGQDRGLLFDLYKYIDSSAKHFVIPQLFTEQRRFNVYDNGLASSQDEVFFYGGSLAFGREFSQHSAFELGLRPYEGDVTTNIGETRLNEANFETNEIFASYSYDKLNDRYLPSSGLLVEADYNYAAKKIGGDNDYKQVNFKVLGAKTFNKRHIVLGRLILKTTLNNENAPFYTAPRGGGFLNLSGFYNDEITGNNFSLIASSYQYRLSQNRLLDARVGFSLEYGGIDENSGELFNGGGYHGSLFLAYRSPLGPAYLGYGNGEGGRHRLFLSLGNVFSRFSTVR